METILVNTIQPKRTIEIVNSKAESSYNFKGSAKIVLDKKSKVNLKE